MRSPSAKLWFVHTQTGSVLGPWDAAQVRTALRGGQISLSDMVRQDETTTLQELLEVDEIFAVASESDASRSREPTASGVSRVEAVEPAVRVNARAMPLLKPSHGDPAALHPPKPRPSARGAASGTASSFLGLADPQSVGNKAPPVGAARGLARNFLVRDTQAPKQRHWGPFNLQELHKFYIQQAHKRGPLVVSRVGQPGEIPVYRLLEQLGVKGMSGMGADKKAMIPRDKKFTPGLTGLGQWILGAKESTGSLGKKASGLHLRQGQVLFASLFAFVAAAGLGALFMLKQPGRPLELHEGLPPTGRAGRQQTGEGDGFMDFPEEQIGAQDGSSPSSGGGREVGKRNALPKAVQLPKKKAAAVPPSKTKGARATRERAPQRFSSHELPAKKVSGRQASVPAPLRLPASLGRSAAAPVLSVRSSNLTNIRALAEFVGKTVTIGPLRYSLDDLEVCRGSLEGKCSLPMLDGGGGRVQVSFFRDIFVDQLQARNQGAVITGRVAPSGRTIILTRVR